MPRSVKLRAGKLPRSFQAKAFGEGGPNLFASRSASGGAGRVIELRPLAAIGREPAEGFGRAGLRPLADLELEPAEGRV